MAGDGPLQWMDELELQHWLALAAARSGLAAAAAGAAALGHFQARASSAGSASSSGTTGSSTISVAFQARTQYGVLPADHPQRTPAVLDHAISLIQAGDEAAAAAALREPLEAANDAFYEGLLPPGVKLPGAAAAAPRLLGAALVLAHLLARVLHTRAAGTADASAWVEGAAALARGQLAAQAAGAPKDSLELPATVLAAALGPADPVAAALAALAVTNLSPAVRKVRASFLIFSLRVGPG